MPERMMFFSPHSFSRKTDSQRGIIRKIGRKERLRGYKLSLFVDYIYARHMENTRPEYLQEWAKRFAENQEYNLSDGEGREILKGLDARLYGGREE